MDKKESSEMYLETILVLTKSIGNVRSLDIAREMGYSKPSVSSAMSKLRNERYVEVGENGYVRLTNSGREIAEKVYERHTIISAVLEKIGVNPKTAAEDACRIEHVISDESFLAIKDRLYKVSK
ncbi:MAG: metal-dependent transcriptional regulator [Saccharofermentans sp.]|jgi:Mn-dependent DtxR family transcriptional regulator|nr:metal-dependent transcriptional regulator [Mageeibacillus sp.]MCI1263858.1 metal-dependent transcriptional regulator [Saccharofermentans sp.]MCI1275360.1 metal-dependent transcriptional regulator [Saccharofermentans sp.]MCI1769738.1 metal-dependent transcriptional regulator [Mageeibacillus sp.]MCI2043792.1 metal-dependent transcriptional regulator [Mageeibacillus sp.]